MAPEEIDVVVLSHLHFDHAGGVLAAWQEDRGLELAFKNARYVVAEDAWQRAIAPHVRDRASFIADLPGLLEATGRLERVRNDSSLRSNASDLLGKGWATNWVRVHVQQLVDLKSFLRTVFRQHVDGNIKSSLVEISWVERCC